MLLVAMVAGVVLGVLCDGLFILRLLLRDPRAMSQSVERSPTHTRHPFEPNAVGQHVVYAILQGFCDLTAVVLATVILMLLCYYTSDGQLRAPAIFGMMGGFWVYHKTVSRLVRRLVAILIGFLFRCLRRVWTYTLGCLLSYLMRTVTQYARNAATTRRLDRLTHEAAHGFGITDDPTATTAPAETPTGKHR